MNHYTWRVAAACVSCDTLLAHQTLLSVCTSRCSTRYFSIRSKIIMRSIFWKFWTQSSLQQSASLFASFSIQGTGELYKLQSGVYFLIFLSGEGVGPVFACRQSYTLEFLSQGMPNSLTGPLHHSYFALNPVSTCSPLLYTFSSASEIFLHHNNVSESNMATMNASRNSPEIST